MSLYFPDSAEDVDGLEPQLHALIIGVGDYLHVNGENAHQDVRGFGLGNLTSTPITATQIVEWLEQRFRHPDCSLGSIELLLSPEGELTRADGCTRTVESATMGNISSAFNRWWVRCNSHEANIAFFYFAGHGISTGTSNFVLPADFGAAGPNLWANCIDFSSMRLGMQENNANTQLFFVDACREVPFDVLNQLSPRGNSLCSTEVYANPKNVGIYYAAAEGRTAHGLPDEVTFFGEAVVESLEGAGARKRDGVWGVDTFELGNAIGKIMDDLGEEAGLVLSSNCDPSGQSVIICEVEAGAVRATVGCKTRRADSDAEITLTRTPEVIVSGRGAERPWRLKLTPGEWDLHFDFVDHAPHSLRREPVFPPTFKHVAPR